MIRKAETLAMTVLLVAAYCTLALGQAPTGSILHMELENATLYIFDCPNSQLAKSTNKLDRPQPVVFESAIGIGDIVSVNGQPVKGAAYETITNLLLASPNPAPGFNIADSSRAGVTYWDLDFLSPDGTQIGTVRISGLQSGPRPPGAPKEIGNGGYIVTGGTGAFFGARGYYQPVQDPVMGERTTSACEDPSLRRINAGGRGKRHPVLYLVPLSPPQVVATANGPAVTHSNDFSLVTASKPAAAGEILSLFATGLGPTRPGVDPGQPFPASPLQAVNSPVDVTVNGKSAEVTAAIGYPGALDGYQVNFRVPPDAAKGTATVQVSAAWIAGPEIKMVIQ